MAKKPPAEQYYFEGNLVSCPICQHTHFWKRKTALSTKRMFFWEMAWLSQEAHNYVCENCGYILWFLQKD